MSNNDDNSTPATTPETEKSPRRERDYRFVTLRISPALHNEVERMTARLHFSTGKRVSVNSLVTRYIEEGLKRDTNPKMLKDFEGM
jgi:predicted HicB family RNase H-like nuclease